MLYDFAPMEGITGRLFRLRHHQYFGGADRYFTPFLSPNQHHVFSFKELGDVLPEGNGNVPIVPQILTKNAEDFLWCAGELAQMGYKEVNLNCGCPSGTVAAKGKGAGMLEDLGRLEAFLDAVFEKADVPVSIKTRLGLVEDEEFWPVLEIFDRYPLAQLIIHPRVQKDFYKGRARVEVFDEAAERTALPLGYNGDLVSEAACGDFAHSHPGVKSVMVGRGLLADPALFRKCKGGKAAEAGALQAFYENLFEDYCEAFHSVKNAIRPMKELWSFQLRLFAGEDKARLTKALRKCTDGGEYREIVRRIFRELELLEEPGEE